MKYYHLIYNSSQRTQEGMVGLGIRSYTEGMPKEYMDALKENGFFSYSSGSKPQPAPKDLLENGSLIFQLPVTYNFAKLFVPSTGKDIFVISRTVSVGFDYPYYVKFTASRMDNFVLDAYVFEEAPSIDVFQVFYEQPGSESIGFVPRNRIPCPENKEMKALSLDKMPLFAFEEKSFVCDQLQPVCPQAIELLFAFLEAHRLNLPLLVKCKNEDAASFMVDMIRILPEHLRKDLFFFVNYQLEGVKEGYKVFFIDDSYKFNYADYGQFYVFDMTQTDKVKTPESDLFRSDVAQFVEQDNQLELNKRIAWMFNPVYNGIRDKSDDVKRIFYNYVIEKDHFEIADVFNYKGDELWDALKTYFDQDTNNQLLFNEKVEYYLKNEQVVGERLLALLFVLNKMSDFGFSLNDVIAGAKPQVSSKLLQTPESFRQALDRIEVEKLKKYFDKKTFEKYQNYLDDKRFFADWGKLYKLFYSDELLANPNAIISILLVKQMPLTMVDMVMAEYGVDKLRSCALLTSVAKNTHEVTESVFVCLWKYLNNIISEHNELPGLTLAHEIDQIVLKPLAENTKYQNERGQCKTLMQLLMGNFTQANAKSLIATALTIGTKQTASLLFDKGLGYVEAKQVDQVVGEIVNNLKPDNEKFIRRVQYFPQKLLLFVSFFKASEIDKKTLNKMQKDGILKLDDNEYKQLLFELGFCDEDKSKVKNNRSIIVAAVAALLIIGTCAIIIYRPSKERSEGIIIEVNAPKSRFIDTIITLDSIYINDSLAIIADTLIVEKDSTGTNIDALNRKSLKPVLPDVMIESNSESNDEQMESEDGAEVRLKIVTHVVQSGETLRKIASSYGVTVENIKEWNHLTNDNIQVGKEVFIYRE